MKVATLVAAVLSVVVVAGSQALNAADPWNNAGSRMQPTRGFLGLPVPQQWSSGRAPMANSGLRYGVPTSDLQNNSVNCVNGFCGTAACANGQCLPGVCQNGQCATQQCPNGNCGYAPNAANRTGRGTVSDWFPRTTRAPLADPFRRSEQPASRDSWTQRSGRPVLPPLEDAFNSRYNREDLNLRNEYFGSDPADRYRETQDYGRSNSETWSRPTSRRSMEAPAESVSGIARF